MSATRIFARPLEAARQLLVYGMTVEVAEDVAMILPIPTPPGSPDDAVRFVDMSSCPAFFDHLSALFPAPASFGAGYAVSGAAPQARTLVVHDVGDFEASFVPTLRDFKRLDARFRLPGEVWDELPELADWGFCVFKLKAPQGKGSSLFRLFQTPKATSRKVHPMAFEFPRRDASSLFFPTMHVHDRSVHPTAEFDHELYCQTSNACEPLMQWSRSSAKAAALAEVARPWVDPSAWLYKRALHGELPNRDTLLAEAKLRARTVVNGSFRLRMLAAWEHLIDDGRTTLDARTRKWMRVGEAERARVRDSVSAELTTLFADKGAAWGLSPFVHDLAYESFFASNERFEPQELDLVFAQPPNQAVRESVQQAFQSALDAATR